MKSLYNILGLVLIVNILTAQVKWDYYTSDFWVQAIEVIDDKVIVGNPAGVHILDIETGEGKFFNSINSELRGSFVWEILAAEDHFWVALNEGGIAKYTFDNSRDGGHWEQFYTPIIGDLDTIHRARNMMEDADGTLWFDMAWDGRGHLISLEDHVVTDYSYLFSVQPYFFSCHGSERIYYRDENNPLNYFDVRSKTLNEVPLLNSDWVINSFKALNDEVYVSVTDDEGNYLYKYNNEWVKIEETEEVITFSKTVKGKDRLWQYFFDTPDFASISSDGYKHFTLADLAGDQIDPGTRFEIFSEDDEGRIWLNTYGSGSYSRAPKIYSIRDEIVTTYDLSHNTQADQPFNKNMAAFDCKGNLLIPGLTSLQVFHPDSVKDITRIIPDRQNGDLEVIAVDTASCKYYVSHDTRDEPGFVYVFEDDKVIDTITVESGLSDQIHVSSKGQLFVNKSNKGIGIYDLETRQWEWHKEPLETPQSSFNSVITMNESKTGIMSFGTFYSLVVYEDGIWTTYDNTNSPLGEFIFTHLIDSNGNILVEHEGGIYFYDGIEWEYTAFFDPYENGILSIFEDEVGNYWLGTFDSGLLYWNGFDYQQFDIMNSAIPSNKIIEILAHPHSDDLWLLGDRGLIVFDRDAVTFKKGLFGKAFYDAEENMVYDAGNDVGLDNVMISVSEDEKVLTDVNGNFAFYPEDSGQFVVDCTAPSDFIHTGDPSYSATFRDEDIFDINFGLYKEIGFEDLEVDIALSPFVCAGEVSAWITIKNPGWNTVDGNVSMTLPTNNTILSILPEGDLVSGQQATWSFENLSFREQRTFYAVIRAPSVEAIIDQFGIIENVTIPITAILDYEGTTQTYKEDVQFLCSYDPNDKLAASSGPTVDNYSLLEDQLHYTIRFQNEGNYKATHVVIVDTIDTQLDVESISIISSSHSVQTEINRSNEITFRFMDINLPPESESEAGSQGFVKFSISPINDLPDNSLVLNTAHIYFDSNAPIVTNTTENILVEELPLSSTDEIVDQFWNLSLYPNPSLGKVILEPNLDSEYSYTVYNSSGQLVLSEENIYGNTAINLDKRGLYLLSAISGNKSFVEKIVIE